MNDRRIGQIRRFPFSIVSFALALGVPLLGRLALILTRFADIEGVDLFRLMVIGIQLDAVVAGALAAPLALLALTLPSRMWAKKILIWCGTLGLAFLAFCELGGWFFFSNFDVRPNYLVLEYGADLKVVKTMSSAYSWVLVVLAVLVFGGVTQRFLAWTLRGSPKKALRDWLATAGVLIVACLCIRGTFDHRPLNPSLAAFSSNRLANEIAGNGVLNVAYELAHQGKKYYGRVENVAGYMSTADAFSFARARLEGSGEFIENAKNPLLPSRRAQKKRHQRCS